MMGISIQIKQKKDIEKPQRKAQPYYQHICNITTQTAVISIIRKRTHAPEANFHKAAYDIYGILYVIIP